MLEGSQHLFNAFVTLTYREECLPPGGSLRPRDTQLWLKRIRKEYGAPLRYYLVGEYGEQTKRPHYHVALFGFPACAHGRSRYDSRRVDCCRWCDMVRDTWRHGIVCVGSLSAESSGYVAGYVTKKLTARGHPELEGRHPEFSRMSTRPGIGASAMDDVASVLLEHGFGPEMDPRLLERNVLDVPNELRQGERRMPLGRYLKNRLRVLVGMEKGVPQVVYDIMEAEMLPVRVAARADETNPSIKARVIEMNAGKCNNVEARAKLRARRKVL